MAPSPRRSRAPAAAPPSSRPSPRSTRHSRLADLGLALDPVAVRFEPLDLPGRHFGDEGVARPDPTHEQLEAGVGVGGRAGELAQRRKADAVARMAAREA